MGDCYATPYETRLLGTWVIRRWLHGVRFRWAVERIKRLGGSISIIELGPGALSLLDWLDRERVAVNRYLGLDANWEGGLEKSRATWAGRSNVQFRTAVRASDVPQGEYFDVAVALATFEHIKPLEEVELYLRALRNCAGRILIDVPIERGLIFPIKYLAQTFCRTADSHSYTSREWLNALVGRLDHVERYEHKGFDERKFIQQIASTGWRIQRIDYNQHLWPRSLNFGVGIEGV